jgi:transposase InsO family protein
MPSPNHSSLPTKRNSSTPDPGNDLAGVQRHTFLWIEGYYNLRRRHSTLNYLTPLEYKTSVL